MNLSSQVIKQFEDDFSDLENEVMKTVPQTLKGVVARIRMTVNDPASMHSYKSGEKLDICNMIIAGVDEESEVVMVGAKGVVTHAVLVREDKIVYDPCCKSRSKIEDGKYFNPDFPGLGSKSLNVIGRLAVKDI